MSRLWNILRVVIVPNKWLNHIRTLIHHFVIPLWPIPSWNIICLKRNQGGLNVVQVHHQKRALQLVYVQRMTQEDTAQDFCTPIVRGLFQYYTGTVGWGNVGCSNVNIKRLVKSLPCLATLCTVYADLPSIPKDNDPDNWYLQLAPSLSCKIIDAPPGAFRRTLHPDHHWRISLPAPPSKIFLGWRIPSSTWQVFCRIKMPHRATTVWWRLFQDCLSTKEKIQQRSSNMISDAMRSYCTQAIETDFHLLLGLASERPYMVRPLVSTLFPTDTS